MVDNDVIKINLKIPVFNFVHLLSSKSSVNKIFLFGLVFILYFFKLSGTIGFCLTFRVPQLAYVAYVRTFELQVRTFELQVRTRDWFVAHVVTYALFLFV